MSKIFIGEESVLASIIITKQKYHLDPRVTEEELRFVTQAMIELASKIGLDLTATDLIVTKFYDFDGEFYSKKEDVPYEMLLERYKFYFQSLPIFDCKYIFSQLKRLEALKTNPVEYNPAKIDVLLEKILDHPDEFYKKLASTLGPEEYYFLENSIQNKKCSNCSKKDCNRRENDGVCPNWHNPELVGKAKIMKKN